MVHRAGSNSGVRVAIANTRCKFLVCHMKFCNRTKTSVPNGGKTGHGIYRLDKNSVLSYLYDKDQEGLENLIEDVTHSQGANSLYDESSEDAQVQSQARHQAVKK